MTTPEHTPLSLLDTFRAEQRRQAQDARLACRLTISQKQKREILDALPADRASMTWDSSARLFGVPVVVLDVEDHYEVEWRDARWLESNPFVNEGKPFTWTP